MFSKVSEPDFVRGEHEVLRFWRDQAIFARLREKNALSPKQWSFLDGPITANNPMGVHHAWGRTYKDAFQRFFAMTGHRQRYQNGFDCQGLWVEVEVEKELKLGTKRAIESYGIDRFVNECKRRVLRFAARQTEQSIRLGYWMEWDHPEELRKLAEAVGTDATVTLTTPRGQQVQGKAHELVARLGNPEWGGSYFTFSTENNETIWTFLKKCYERGKVYRGHDVMPWSGNAGSAYSQMEVADGRRLTTHRACFVRFPLLKETGDRSQETGVKADAGVAGVERSEPPARSTGGSQNLDPSHPAEYLLVWTTTPWTLTSNVACAVNPDLDYVKLRSKRDGSIYYFAKDNLEYKRLDKEFKEGFGRPEWGWPQGTPKLKTLGQLFKEQGGYEIEATIKGAEMIGWRYAGPFDDLAAQQSPGGFPESSPEAPSAVECHRVIDGGRDFKGSPNVVAGEGTGIVHIAPGCGDIDHQIGKQLGLAEIAPLREDGTFDEGFGDFTGRSSIDPATAQLVFDKLKEKHLLVYVEDYPHIYPHCWRTGDELVFRLVDEWFINMDWRDEIKAVVAEANWLPDSIDGKTRETEWLTNMRDWMVSKKRFWGLALPIWINPDDPTDFDVIGSLAELKERAVEGWDGFTGNTPHRPWIDRVKIKSTKTGATLQRIPDVGNPWLDAGIVPFSTLQYNTNKDEWRKWYPPDFVTECFPGQFRNWFYSLLALSTMMRYDETDDPKEKRPFKTLLGHRLVMNEEGKPMHKSDGTAIWFEEAAEQLGVDTMRWMYLAQNPAVDLRFGTRHPDQPVTLETVDGPISKTREGLTTYHVTSKPSDEVRRQILIPLWNSYAFFVNYARLDGFDPSLPQVPVSERPEIDRWILSNLQALIQTTRKAFTEFNSPEACRAAAAFIDDLSNWYIRRNRRRFWRSRQSEGGMGRGGDGANASGWDADKLAAYQTLYHVLVTLTKLLAPAIPFLTERMYQNLVLSGWSTEDAAASPSVPRPSTLDPGPSSVHLCDYPEVDAALLDESLNRRTSAAQLLVTLPHGLREKTGHRTRQPLAELQFACASAEQRHAIETLADVVKDELNVKKVTSRDNLDDLVHYAYKPNLKTLGPKLGKLLNLVKTKLPTVDPHTLAPLRRGEQVTLTLDGNEITLAPEDVMVSTEQASDWVAADDQGIQIALSTTLTPELIREGMARDFVRHVQQLRKDEGLEIEDRIRITWSTDDATATQAINDWSSFIATETLADGLSHQSTPTARAKPVPVGEASVALQVERT